MALVGFPKFGEDITPDILPMLMRLKAFVIFAKTFRLAPGLGLEPRF